MNRNTLNSLTSSTEDKTGLYHIIIGLVIFVLVVILMETHNYYTGKYDEKDDEKEIKLTENKPSDKLRDETHIKQNINIIRRKNTVIIKD